MTSTLSFAPGVSERVDASALECLTIVGAMQGLQLTVPQLVQDNALESAEVDYAKLVHCARGAGMKAKALHSIRSQWKREASIRGTMTTSLRA